MEGFKNSFPVSYFFDLESCSFAEIFEGIEHVWDVLPRIESYIKQQFESGKLTPNYKALPNVFVGEGTVIEEGAFIHGPAIIGKNCLIRHASYLRQDLILGDNVLIGHATEIKNTIVLNEGVVNHFNYVGDSIVGSKVNMAAGSVAANLRLDKSNIYVKVGDERIDTGLKKFGSIIGDRSEIGVNAVLNPGTILGKNVVVYPLTSVKGVHKEGETVR